MATTVSAVSQPIPAKKTWVPPIPLTVAAILGGVGIVGYAMFARWGGLSFSVVPSDLMKLTAPLILTAGFIERAVEVLVSPWRDAEANRLRETVKLAQA